MGDHHVLSLQSHVVSGYVGNKAAVFPQQVLGFDVDSINSVQFSNHTGYPTVKGSVMNGEQLEQIAQGLHDNLLDDYNYVLTGYIGSESFLISVLKLLDQIQQSNPEVKYVCDPVLGDNGKYYVPKDLVPLFINKVLSRAFMITPNQFEAELLSGVQIKTEEDILNALKLLHALGPKIVVITSSDLQEYPEKLCCFVSDRTTDDSSKVCVTKIIINKLPGHFTGTGDCTAGLMLAWVDKLGPGHAGEALVKTISTMQGIIRLSIERQYQLKLKAVCKRNPTLRDGDVIISQNNIDQYLVPSEKARFSELCVIHGKKLIEEPPECDMEVIISFINT